VLGCGEARGEELPQEGRWLFLRKTVTGEEIYVGQRLSDGIFASHRQASLP